MKFNPIKPTLREMLKGIFQVNVNIWANIKDSINVILLCNSTFYFLHGFKDRGINYKYVIIHTT